MAGRSVLLIEDDEMLAETCAEQLRAEGYVARLPERAKKAYACCRRKSRQ